MICHVGKFAESLASGCSSAFETACFLVPPLSLSPTHSCMITSDPILQSRLNTFVRGNVDHMLALRQMTDRAINAEGEFVRGGRGMTILASMAD